MTMDVFRRRFRDPGRMAELHTPQITGSRVRQLTRGTPSEVPVPRKMTVLLLDKMFHMASAHA